MKSGKINLKPLYDFVYDEYDLDIKGEGLYGNSSKGREYMARVRLLLAGAEVDKKRGVYLFGAYDERKVWKSIYLGMAEDGKINNLRQRLQDQLNDARLIFWRATMTEAEILTELNIKYRGKYKRYTETNLLKTGATHIVWVSAPHLQKGDLNNVEADLIETLNPFANIKRPKPDAISMEKTKELLEEIRSVINRNRDHYSIGTI